MQKETDTPAPQRDLQSVIEANRQLDAAVASIEEAVWAPSVAPTFSPRPPASIAAHPPTPAPPPVFPAAFSAAAARSEARPPPLRMVAMAPAPVFGMKPAAGPAAPPGPIQAPATVIEDLSAVVGLLQAEAADLRRRRNELLKDIAFLLPWSPKPRPALLADNAPYQVDDAELRDVIQPHWRAISAQAATAEAELAAAREAERNGPAWRRAWLRRTALKTAEDAAEAARQAVETAELIWGSDSVLERRAQMRRQVEEIREAGVATVEGVPELNAAIAATDAALALAATLNERGVRRFERRPNETPTQAMARVVAS